MPTCNYCEKELAFMSAMCIWNGILLDIGDNNFDDRVLNDLCAELAATKGISRLDLSILDSNA